VEVLLALVASSVISMVGGLKVLSGTIVLILRGVKDKRDIGGDVECIKICDELKRIFRESTLTSEVP
jgi:hypothetical protein